jgi:hypothetical protein
MLRHFRGGTLPLKIVHLGAPGVISRKFSVREIATKSLLFARKKLHLEKQYVLLYVASYAERDVTVLDSKTGSVTSG